MVHSPSRFALRGRLAKSPHALVPEVIPTQEEESRKSGQAPLPCIGPQLKHYLFVSDAMRIVAIRGPRWVGCVDGNTDLSDVPVITC